MQLYKSLVEPSHRNCNRIRSAVDRVLDRAARMYGDEAVDRCGTIDLEYFEKGSNAAITAVGTAAETGLTMSVIQFSMQLVASEAKQMIAEIVPHEVAHAICMANSWDNGHGQAWKSVCLSLGGDGNTRNTMKVMDGRYSRVYEAFHPEGGCVWLSFEQYKMAASRGIIVRNKAGQSFGLTKHNLTGKLIAL